MEMHGWRVARVNMREEWRYVLGDCGELYVITTGISLKPLLYVSNWTSMANVSNNRL